MRIIFALKFFLFHVPRMIFFALMMIIFELIFLMSSRAPAWCLFREWVKMHRWAALIMEDTPAKEEFFKSDSSFHDYMKMHYGFDERDVI